MKKSLIKIGNVVEITYKTGKTFIGVVFDCNDNFSKIIERDGFIHKILLPDESWYKAKKIK